MMNTMTSFTVLGMLKTVIVVAVLGRGTHSHSNYGPSASFNDFISNNAIINSINNTAATGSGMVASTGNGHSSAVDLTSRNEAARLYRMRQRSRNHRLQSLRFQILRRLGMDQLPTVTVSPEVRHRVMETLDQFPALTQTAFTQPLEETTERRCYSASCDIPHKVNETMWRDPDDLGLRLYVPLPRNRNNGAELLSASLHLFLRPSNMLRERCACEREETDGSGCHCVNGLLVSVYQFVRPLSIRRRGRVVNRRRLLDAKFVPATGNAWISFNIGSVANDWRRHRRNFGMEVTIKDDNETEIDARTLIVLPDCSVGREIGCREVSSDSAHGYPWLVSYRDNFPYVDMTSVRPTTSTGRGRRSAPRAPRHHRKLTAPYNRKVFTSLKKPVNTSCSGKSVIVNVTDPEAEEPKSFLSLVCPTICWDCLHDKQCTERPCRAPHTEPVMGRYRIAGKGPGVVRPLPVRRIVACGC